MEIKAIIVDDEMDGRLVLEHLITNHCPEVKVLRSFSNAEEATYYLKSNKIDLLFLDINMPQKDGFSMIEDLETCDFHIVFVTAYDQYAIKAIKYAAFDYLLKPLDHKELQLTIGRLAEEVNYTKQKVKTLTHNLEDSHANHMALPIRDGYTFLDVKDIVRCEADSNYCNIYMANGEKHVASKTLKNIEALLPSTVNFFRVHKSNIINLNYVKNYLKSEGVAVLFDESHVEVSRRNKEGFLEKMGI